MADSLFDKRYRYDYIYPRGRSGETLRAVDIEENEREVVIKRPGPNDAPPIRAGQEVSINNERRALQRLSGHKVLTELLNQGQFFVGGMPHQYIVMERATGVIVGDEVLELNANGERLPELEILVIIDQLLDLLHAAHAKDIVYNDVDAKHLFWDRENYQLKVIDWGNAVFLEGDEVTQQGISRQTDVYQVGELLYFIFTGGRRAEIPRDADTDFKVDFGEDSRRVHSRLQEIISKALHPNVRLRYPNITALRADLSNYRSPLERERNIAVAAIAEKVKRGNLTMSELRAAKTSIEPLRKLDPGYPPTQEVFNSIEDQFRDLSVEADLDAVRIYMENSNWERSVDLIRSLREKAGTKTGGLSDLLLDICFMLADSPIEPTPQPIQTAIKHLFDEKNALAALTLLESVAHDDQRDMQWQIAERISAHMPEVLLLRPNLYRINKAINQLAPEGYEAVEVRTLLDDIDNVLTNIASGALNVAFLRDSYRAVVDKLTALNPLLQTFAAQHQLSTRRVPLNSVERAISAAMALADNMHIIGKQAISSPHEVLQALETSRTIDSVNPIWEDLDDLLQRLYERLQNSQTYIPAADGSDLQNWLETTHSRLRPFQERLFDEMLANILENLEKAISAWGIYQKMVLAGHRDKSISALEHASRHVTTISPALSQWFRQLKAVVTGANYIERHALPGGLGRALADGWAAFDRGRLAEAERLGQQALEIARNEDARFAAKRLQDLSRIAREWVERNGVASASRTEVVLKAVENMFTADENQIRQDFEAQMPSIDTYLKAMNRGLVSTFSNTSTAGLRILFMSYILQGTLDVHAGLLEDGEFWHEAATKTLADTGERHVAARTLSEYIAHRRDIIEASTVFSQINGKHIIPEIPTIRRKLENNAQARLLSSGIQSLRDVEVALRDWADGDFRAAGLKLESAVRGISEVEQAANLELDGFRAWLMDLMENAANLTVRAREMRALIEQRPDKPDDTIGQTLNQQVMVTEKLLGDETAATLRQRRDTYEQFVSILTSDERRTPRLEKLNELFRAMFIDQHPAYPLYRHWYALLEAQGEFAAPFMNDPVPREENAEDIPEIVYRTQSGDIKPNIVLPPHGNNRIGRMLLYGGFSIVALTIIGFVAMNLLGQNDIPEIALTISATPNQETQSVFENATSTAIAAAQVRVTDTSVVHAATTQATVATTPSIIPTATNERTIILQTEPPTNTPTNTVTPSATNTATNTPTPSVTPTSPPPTRTPLPENGVRGRQDLLALFARETTATADFINPATFFGVDGGFQLETDASSSGDVVRVVPSLNFLDTMLGNNAASRLTSVEADISLLTFNPNLLDDEQGGVFFGITMESATDGNNIGLQINALNNTSITVYDTQNGVLTALRTRSVGSIVVRLRIDRDIETGNVLLFLNDEQIGATTEFLEPDAQVLPVLFVRDGGVIIRINAWRITLR